jgi:hypothetical protein
MSESHRGPRLNRRTNPIWSIPEDKIKIAVMNSNSKDAALRILIGKVTSGARKSLSARLKEIEIKNG